MKKIKIENKFLKKVVVLGITLVLITSFLVPAGILNIRNVFGNLFYKADGSVKAEGNPLPVLLSDPPLGFTATANSRTQIYLSWTKNSTADTTYIERNNAETWNLGEGTMVYNDSGTSHQDSGLNPGTQYFYQAWSWNYTDLYSITYEEANTTTFTNQPPVLSWEIPVDDSGNIDIMQATVNVTIRDPEGDSFNWTIEGLYVTNSGQDNDVNGSKSASLITPLPYDTDIVWFVNVTDGYSWTNATYNFTTRVQYATGVGVIEGIVKNWGSGEPLEDAYVYIVGGHFNLSEFDIALVATKEQTNAEGKYQAVDVPSGLYIILVLRNGSGSLSDGWFPALRYTSVNPGETTVENFELISLSRSTSVKMFSRVPEFHLFYVDKLISMFLK